MKTTPVLILKYLSAIPYHGIMGDTRHDRFDAICEQNINYFAFGSSCHSVLYAIPHEGTDGYEFALWMATRD